MNVQLNRKAYEKQIYNRNYSVSKIHRLWWWSTHLCLRLRFALLVKFDYLYSSIHVLKANFCFFFTRKYTFKKTKKTNL